MDYPALLRLPQYFRNLQRLSEIVRVLIKHGFGDVVSRMRLSPYLEPGIRLLLPGLTRAPVLTQDLATRFRLACEELGPTFIKLAQIIATRPDIFPDRIILELRKLQDRVPPFSASAAKDVIEQELNRTVEELFLRFETVPLAAASIAQVHRAQLRDGYEVVIKVRRPNLQKIIDTDIDILRGLATLIEENIPESSSYSPLKLIEEFSRSLRAECDLEREALNIKKFADNMQDEDDLIVPRVFPEFSTSKVLTEQYIDGFKADDLENIELHNIDKPKIVSTLNRLVLKSIFEHRFFHADPHPGNVLLTRDNKIALIDFGAMGRIDQGRLQEILPFLIAVLSRDLDRMLRILHENQITPPAVDETSLKIQVAEILDYYLGQTLEKLDLSSLLIDIFEVVRDYGIKPPPDLLLVGKALTTIEYIGASLDPAFNPVQAIKPYLMKRYLAQLTDTRLYTANIAAISDSYRRFVTDLPRDLRSILKSLSRGTLSISTSRKDLGELKRHQNKLLNRALGGALGIGLFALGLLVRHVATDGFEATLAYILFVAGGLSLFLTWLAIKRSGGMS